MKSSHTDPQFLPPLKPKRALFYLFLSLFIAWCLALAIMFVTTVYPHPELDPHRRPPATTPEK